MTKIEKISKSFKSARGELKVLNDFSPLVKDGQFFGIAGKSGAGKSTLLSIIAGLQEPDSGRILIEETDIFKLDDKKRSAFRNKNIGFVSQEQSFLANLTVLDNVRLPASIGGTGGEEESIARAKELLESLGISALADCYPGELSGGENHRILIARALMNDPSIILADEPTASLDREQADAVIEIFKKLAESGKTVIMVSHDQEALKACDEVIRL